MTTAPAGSAHASGVLRGFVVIKNIPPAGQGLGVLG